MPGAGAVHSIKSRHRSTSASCPLYPQKRTLIEALFIRAMSGGCLPRAVGSRLPNPIGSKEATDVIVPTWLLARVLGFSLCVAGHFTSQLLLKASTPAQQLQQHRDIRGNSAVPHRSRRETDRGV